MLDHARDASTQDQTRLSVASSSPCEDLQAFPDAGYRYHFSVHPSALQCPELSYLFPYTRKSFSPATGLYSPSCRAFIPFSHASFFDVVWKVVSSTNLLCVGLSMMLFPL